MSLSRYPLLDDDLPPGFEHADSETVFRALWQPHRKKKDAERSRRASRALAFVSLSLTSDTVEEAAQALASAQALGLPPKAWAGWAVLMGHVPSLQALSQAGVDWMRLHHYDKDMLATATDENQARVVHGVLAAGGSSQHGIVRKGCAQEIRDLFTGPKVPWVVVALQQDAHDCADALIDGGALDIPDPAQRQELLDQCLWAVARSRWARRTSHRNECPVPDARWRRWRDLLDRGANPYRLWPIKSKVPDASMLAFAPASLTLRSDKEPLNASNQRTPAHQIVDEALMSRHVSGKALTHAALRILLETLRPECIPLDGWGRDLEGVLMGTELTLTPEAQAFLAAQACAHPTTWNIDALWLSQETKLLNRDSLGGDDAWRRWEERMAARTSQDPLPWSAVLGLAAGVRAGIEKEDQVMWVNETQRTWLQQKLHAHIRPYLAAEHQPAFEALVEQWVSLLAARPVSKRRGMTGEEWSMLGTTGQRQLRDTDRDDFNTWRSAVQLALSTTGPQPTPSRARLRF